MENSIYFRPSKAVIQLEAIRNNIRNVKNFLGKEKSVIAVVKAEGYGNGAVEVARAAFQAGAEMVSVATPDEAVKLREAGIVGDILVMGPSPTTFAPIAAELDIIVAVSDAGWLTSAIQNNDSFEKPLKIHVKIDSGMGRIGLREKDSLYALLEVINHSRNIVLDGVFTHFARADEEDSSWTEKQFKKFMEIVQSFPEKPRLVHAANSAATLLYPHISLDAVRFGIGLYGIAPSEYVEKQLPFTLERSMTLESELAFVKLVPAGEPISYGGTYKTSEDEWVGTIPFGYADGLRRGLRGQEVLVGGKRAPIVGTIAMDQCMVKLPHEMPIGEKVVLIGRQGEEEIKMEEWAERLGTIPYEITVSISKRVPRIYQE